MATFEFSIVASGLDPSADDFETRFYDAGCDDATVSFQRGHTIIDFAREADTAEAAIMSALAAVISVGARVDRVEPDPLVSLSDIAERAELTRSATSMYAKGQRGKGFPSPVARVTTGSPLYAWAPVSRWLHERGQLGPQAAEEAAAIARANARLDASRELEVA